MKKVGYLTAFLILSFFSISQSSFEWAKQFGGTKSAKSKSIAVDALGNVYTLGFFDEVCDFDPGVNTYTLSNPNQQIGGVNMFISKLDANGDFVWVKQVGSGEVDPYSIFIDGSGNIYTTGKFAGKSDFDPGAGTYTMTADQGGEAFVLKLNALGDFVWAKNLGKGAASVIATSINVDGQGSVYTIGYLNSASGSGDFDPGAGTYTMNTNTNVNGFISKLDNNGNFVWAKCLISYQCFPNYLTFDGSENLLLAGRFNGITDFDPSVGTYTLSSGSSDSFILKLDGNGNFIWVKKFTGGSSNINSIKMDFTTDMYLVGSFAGTTDFDPNNGTYSLTSAGLQDIFVTKLNSSGVFIWARNFGSGIAYTCDIDNSGNPYITGSFGGQVDFDPGANVFNLSSSGMYEDAFILKLNSSGDFAGAKQLGGNSIEVANCMILDMNGNLYAAGYFDGTCDFDPGIGVFNLTHTGGYNVFVYKMSELAMSISENSSSTDINIYPNPTSDFLNIKANSHYSSLQIEIANALGQIVLAESMKDKSLQINTKDLATGLYFLKLLSDNKIIATQKIVKE